MYAMWAHSTVTRHSGSERPRPPEIESSKRCGELDPRRNTGCRRAKHRECSQKGARKSRSWSSNPDACINAKADDPSGLFLYCLYCPLRRPAAVPLLCSQLSLARSLFSWLWFRSPLFVLLLFVALNILGFCSSALRVQSLLLLGTLLFSILALLLCCCLAVAAAAADAAGPPLLLLPCAFAQGTLAARRRRSLVAGRCPLTTSFRIVAFGLFGVVVGGRFGSADSDSPHSRVRIGIGPIGVWRFVAADLR